MLNLSNSDLLIKGQKLAALTKIFVPKVFILLTPAAPPLDSRELWFAPDPASPLPTVGWLVTTQLAAHLRSIPHLLSADHHANFICHMSFYGGRLIGKRLPPTSFSFSWTASQPASVQYLGQASPSACTAWLAVTEYGVERRPLASWMLRVLVGTSGYLQVLLVTCGYMWLCVGSMGGGYHLPPGVYRQQQIVIVQRLPSPNRIRLWEGQRMWWRLIVVKWKRKDASQFTSFFTLEVERV